MVRSRPSDPFARQAALELVNPEVEAFGDVDEAFYAYPDDLQRLLGAYEARAVT